jgi:hypothetical protein
LFLGRIEKAGKSYGTALYMYQLWTCANLTFQNLCQYSCVYTTTTVLEYLHLLHMLWSIGLDAAGAKHLGYDPLWPRRWDNSAHQNGSTILMPCDGRLPASRLSLWPPLDMEICWAFCASRGRLWYMLLHNNNIGGTGTAVLQCTLQYFCKILSRKISTAKFQLYSCTTSTSTTSGNFVFVL